MPGMDGFEFLAHARRQLEQSGIPPSEMPTIAAVTGHVESDYVIHALENGIDYIYSKPLDSTSVQFLMVEHGFNINIKETICQ